MAITRVQTPISNGTNAASVTVTLGSTPIQGNLVIAWANSDATVTIGGSGWALLTSVVDGNGVYMWAKLAAASEPTAVVFTPSVSDKITAGLAEYGGVLSATADVVKSSTINGVPGTTTTAPSAFTTTAAGDLVVAIVGLHSGITDGGSRPSAPVWTASLVNQNNQGDGTAGLWNADSTKCQSFFGDNLNIGAAGTYSVSCSWTGTSDDRQEIAAAFKAASVPNVRPYRVVPVMRAANW